MSIIIFKTIYRNLLSVYLPIGVISQLPREFANYQAEAEGMSIRTLLNTKQD